MKKIFYLLLLTIIKLNAQVNIPLIDTLIYKTPVDISEYYKYVNKAEMAIVKGDYKNASDLYYKAFEKHYPLFEDLLNSNKIDKKLAFDSVKFQKQIILWRKISYTTTTAKEFLQGVYSFYPELDSNLVLSYEHIIDTVKFVARRNDKLKKQIDSLYKKDQDIRINRVSRSEFIKADSSNYYELLSLIENNTVNFNTVGVNSMQNIYTMLYHQSRYNFTEWIPVIYKQVLNGNFPNKKFAELIDNHLLFNFSSNLDSSAFAYKYGYALYDKYIIPQGVISQQNIEKINKRRAKIMLDDIISQQKKQVWNFRNGLDISLYSFFSLIDVSLEPSKEEIQQAKEQRNNYINKLKRKYKKLLIFDINSNNYDINLKP